MTLEVIMKKLAIVIFMVLMVVVNVSAKDYEVQKKAGSYDVLVKIDRNPPIAGNNNIEITIKDSVAKYVTDAKVVVHYSMPAMPGMPALNYKTDAQAKGNSYKAKINFSMAGSWNVEVRITHHETISAKFTIDAK
jgi:hypothetical protein